MGGGQGVPALLRPGADRHGSPSGREGTRAPPQGARAKGCRCRTLSGQSASPGNRTTAEPPTRAAGAGLGTTCSRSAVRTPLAPPETRLSPQTQAGRRGAAYRFSPGICGRHETRARQATGDLEPPAPVTTPNSRHRHGGREAACAWGPDRLPTRAPRVVFPANVRGPLRPPHRRRPCKHC